MVHTIDSLAMAIYFVICAASRGIAEPHTQVHARTELFCGALVPVPWRAGGTIFLSLGFLGGKTYLWWASLAGLKEPADFAKAALGRSCAFENNTNHRPSPAAAKTSTRESSTVECPPSHTCCRAIRTSRRTAQRSARRKRRTWTPTWSPQSLFPKLRWSARAAPPATRSPRGPRTTRRRSSTSAPRCRGRVMR